MYVGRSLSKPSVVLGITLAGMKLVVYVLHLHLFCRVSSSAASLVCKYVCMYVCVCFCTIQSFDRGVVRAMNT